MNRGHAPQARLRNEEARCIELERWVLTDEVVEVRAEDGVVHGRWPQPRGHKAGADEEVGSRQNKRAAVGAAHAGGRVGVEWGDVAHLVAHRLVEQVETDDGWPRAEHARQVLHQGQVTVSHAALVAARVARTRMFEKAKDDVQDGTKRADIISTILIETKSSSLASPFSHL